MYAYKLKTESNSRTHMQAIFTWQRFSYDINMINYG